MPAARPYLIVWLLLVFAWTANFTIRVGFSALLPPIMRELDLRACERITRNRCGRKRK
jgi:hypothetical protein